ncbi:MAG: hypothetical protein N3D11_12010 [Candidatus Sumerlaeia bacterium]|nr:hypothetical protein [Candidatus Sumerlaeia bacterium]
MPAPARNAQAPAGPAQPDLAAPPAGIVLHAIWGVGGLSFAAIILGFTGYTHSLDDLKVTLQFVMAPVVLVLLAVAVLQRRTQPIVPWVAFSLLAYLLLGLLSTLLADFRWLAWQEWGFELAAMAAFAVAAWTASTPRRFRNFCRFYFYVGCVTIVFGLFHYCGGIEWLLYRLYPGGRQPAPRAPLWLVLRTLAENRQMLSTILNRDFYPAYLLMIAPLAVPLCMESPRAAGKAFYALAASLYVVCILLAQSNDSYAALLVATVLLVGLLLRRTQWNAVPKATRTVWLVGGLVILLTASAYYAVELPLRLKLALRSRSIMWKGAWKIFWDPSQPAPVFARRALIGSGPGGYLELFPLYRDPDYYRWQIAPITQFSHSQIFDLLAERGATGTAAFAAFLAGMAALLFRQIRRREPESPLRAYQAALLAALIAISIQNLTSPNIRWTACAFNYWFLLGLCAASLRLGMSEAERQKADRVWTFSPRLRMAAGVLFLAATGIFGAAAIPYGFCRFPAAKHNNDGRVYENDMSRLIDLMTVTPPGETREKLRRAAMQSARGAVEAFERSLRWSPTFLASHYLLGHVAARWAALSNDEAESLQIRRRALEAYTRLTELAPDYADVHLSYGLVLEDAYNTSKRPEDKEQAVFHLERAAAMTHAEQTVALAAKTLLALGELDKAAVLYRRVLNAQQRQPLNYILRKGLREIFDGLRAAAYAAGDRDRVASLCREWLDAHPYDAGVFIELMDILRRQGRHSEALRRCAEWVARNPLDPLPRNVAAVLLPEAKAYRRAVSQIEAMIFIFRARRPTVPLAWALQTPENAKPWREPKIEELWLRAGQLMEKLLATTEAVRCYEQSIQAAGNSPVGWQARQALETLKARKK